LTILNNKEYMKEMSFPGVIKVYNKKLTYISSINYKNLAVNDITYDIHQNLHVYDHQYSCVHVLTKDGVHLQSFGHDHKKLMEPFSLCVHAQYVYVADIISHCVFVFPTDGDYVDSFDQNDQEG